MGVTQHIRYWASLLSIGRVDRGYVLCYLSRAHPIVLSVLENSVKIVSLIGQDPVPWRKRATGANTFIPEWVCTLSVHWSISVQAMHEERDHYP